MTSIVEGEADPVRTLMSTRLKRRSVWRPLALTAALLAAQGYLGFNVIGGQFGIESQKRMHADIEDLKATSASLQAQIDAFHHRASLFDTTRLDPDILTERARALLSMAAPDEMLILTDPMTGLPISGLNQQSTGNEVSGIIPKGID
jgi:cell division protein FtsB